MLSELPSLAKLLKTLQQVPYFASKNMYRIAHHFLVMDEQRMHHFCATLQDAKQNLVYCTICFFWKEKQASCLLCSNPKRDKTIICVVETWQELMAIEKTGGYQGVYHVLGGVISPLDGIGPEQLTIDALIDRVINENSQEIILATNQTPEGEATAAYIAHKLKQAGLSVAISCLARGIPVGSSLEYMDRLTVYKALSERRPF